jgi:hypothetical protein
LKRDIEQLRAPQRSRLSEAAKKISSIGNAMEPYFNVVDIFISSHPEWAGLLWVAVRLVFQVRPLR